MTNSELHLNDRPVFRRRELLGVLAGLGFGNIVFHRALAAQADEKGAVTSQMVAQAEWISGITLTDEQREAAAKSLTGTLKKIEQLRELAISYDTPPAVSFRTLRHGDPSVAIRRHAPIPSSSELVRPPSDDDLAFMSVADLARLIRSRKVSSRELTDFYLARLRRYDPSLLCVAEFTEELAHQQADQADRELGSGYDRGALHGIPWGAKDLIAVPGYKTCWGAPQFRQQEPSMKATVAQRLEEAGAVMLAKLSLGALAWGDDWYRGVTRNPWNQREGSSGSSAGSASATAAALVGFAIGSETLGSIVSPCTRCGVTGLRPTFGRISRYGCMTLAWSMDKLGPIARTVEDCALIFAAIHGADGRDDAAVDRPFNWPAKRDPKSLRVGYFEQEKKGIEEREELRILKDMGVTLVPVQLPKEVPAGALTIILNVESASVFDSLTRTGNTEGLNRWPPVFRQAEYIPAVEYIRANRARTMLMKAMESVFDSVDAYVNGDDLTITNMTGHPTVVLPFGTTKRDEVSVPDSLTFTGRLFGESELLTIAHEFQKHIPAAQKSRPPLELLQPIPPGEESKVTR